VTLFPSSLEIANTLYNQSSSSSKQTYRQHLHKSVSHFLVGTSLTSFSKRLPQHVGADVRHRPTLQRGLHDTSNTTLWQAS